MAVPEFLAEASLYRSGQFYMRSWRAAELAPSGGREIGPAWLPREMTDGNGNGNGGGGGGDGPGEPAGGGRFECDPDCLDACISNCNVYTSKAGSLRQCNQMCVSQCCEGIG
jgi:hypothetical protein